MGILAGLISGLLADYLFKSSTCMLGVALIVVALGTGLVYLLPASTNMWPAMLLLIVMAFGVFMGKAVILAPIAELHLPEQINGSAMAVGSFLVYASIFWANPMTSSIVEANREHAHEGYQQIFLMTLVIALVGAACAFALDRANARVLSRQKVQS